MVDVSVHSRRRLLPFVLIEAGLLFVVLAVAAALSAGTSSGPPPGGADARITACTVTGGTAQVGYAVTNRDPVEHAFRVELTVADGSTRLGSAVTLVTRVAPGATETARAMVPVTGNAAGPTCTARANAYDGHAGHHD
jgi:hypothetical protein